MIRATICEIIQDGHILLQHKAAGRFGEGKWNGPGGKLKPNETPLEGVIREVKEETGLTIHDPELLGRINFFFGEKTEPDWTTYIFLVTDYTGDLTPNEEGELKWFNIKEIPYHEMWLDDKHWLPHLIQGKKVKATFWFDEDGEKILRYSLETKKKKSNYMSS